ncbi:hypothetical protein BT63DRAFT_377612 [Microthyrium microscopicum]|uniref:Uncharacterized protein n=1 Tax=Microthyrium microscopicum TaxID=703497 RepID=A0A6A6U1E9_9PEZI|nr:hypothetical protein BT63DRAFT_377612 [Microthyrium microscopicum]
MIQDILPIPESTDPHKKEVAHGMHEEPTESHSIAMAEPDERGTIQSEAIHGQEVVDLGWNEDAKNISNPLIGGVKNEDLWILVRRFNKQMFHLKETKAQVSGGLDLNAVDDEEFSPDKLRSHLERFYMTVIVGFVSAFNHIARLRSWRETRRTSIFAGVYFVAWILDLLMPILSVVMIVLIVSPEARKTMFPPAPLALVNKKTGGVQKPKAGVLGSHDSITGAPENMKGEAVEQEASNFVTSIASIALASTTGKHPQGEPDFESDSTPGDSVPDPSALATGAATAKEASGGVNGALSHDKTKVPMQTAMWDKMRPFMHAVGGICDTWERFGNALSPTAPYDRSIYQLRLAGLVLPLVLVSYITTPYMIIKGIGFGAGFGFFGDPIMTPAINWLNNKFPNWQKILEPRNTILKGVPNDAQLTLTLLRVGENAHSPLPPPPKPEGPPPDQPAELNDDHLRSVGGDWPLNATKEELDLAIAKQPGVAEETSGADVQASAETKHGKKGSRILGLFKSTAKTAVRTAIGTDSLKAKVGSTPAKNRLGVVPSRKENLLSGPVDFKCRFKGHRGHAYITWDGFTPLLAFSTDKKIAELGTVERDEGELNPDWKIDITQVAELRKVGGYGWKAKLVVGWALDREVADALEIVCRDGSQTLLTAIPLRDELFNRACAMGGQKWESM